MATVFRASEPSRELKTTEATPQGAKVRVGAPNQ